MKLFEYQAQALLKEYQIPVPGGKVAASPDDVYSIVSGMKGKAVIKAQVLTGGRGKAGGIKVVSSAPEAKTATQMILGLVIKDNPVHKVFVTPAVEIKKEIYVSIVLNSGAKRLECIISDQGGVDIEELADKHPKKIHKIPVSFEIIKQGTEIQSKLTPLFGIALASQVFSVIEKMLRLYVEKDCSLVEINPLALDETGSLLALDAKIVIDDNALYKHPELEALKNSEEYSVDELDAKKANLAFVSLNGRIGCMVNGAGLAMATMDLIKYYGEEPANFLDIGGSSNPRKVVDGLKILKRNDKVKAILLNIFGGITRCDDIAKGLIEAEKEFHIGLPLVIRLIGTNDKEGLELLQNNGFTAFSSLPEAVKEVVEKVKGL